MIRPGDHGLAAGAADRACDAGIVGRDDDPAEPGLHGATPDMDDHRLAVDVGERLARAGGWPPSGRERE